MIRGIRSISVVLAASLLMALMVVPASAATRTLTVTKAGSGNGTVTSLPAGISCGATCSAGFGQGTAVTLTATPDANSVFSGWSGAGCSGTGTCVVTMPNGNSTTSVTATFDGVPRQLTVTKAGTGSGTVTSVPPGSSCGVGCLSFPHGTVVTLTATADASSTFGGWSGGGCGGTGTCVVTMNANRAVTATFTLKSYVLSVSKSGTGGGAVISSPAGINCGVTCSANYSHGAVVTLSATPDVNSTFTGWSDPGCPGTGTCLVTLTSATSVTATFTAITHQLTVNKAGTGAGTVTSNPVGIDCGPTCSAAFPQGSSVTLNAVPDLSSSFFAGWSGSGCSGTQPCTVLITTAKSVTATFTLNSYQLSVSKTGTGTGTVTSNPTGINCGATCSATYNHGTSVTLTAVASGSSTFTGWNGGGCGGTGTCVVSMTGATSVTATFALKSYTLTVTKGGTGDGTVTSSPPGVSCGATCSMNFNHGTVVTLTATPDANSTFTGWSGGGCGGTGTCVVTMTAATSVTATFSAITHDLDVTLSGTGTGSVLSSPVGIDCGTTCTASFNQGSTVTLTAAADVHSTFTGWSGAGCSGTGTCVLSISAARSVDAEFTLNRYPATVVVTGSGGGAVTSDVGAIDCGATCGDSYDALTDVVLTATPDANSVFAGWSGDCSGTGTCELSIDGAKAATATFVLKVFQVTVDKAGAGLGTVTSDVGGIDCGAICSDTYDALDVVTLTATPAANSTFAGWSGDCSGTGECVLDMLADKSATATFDPTLHDVIVATTGAGSGTVTSSPAGIDCGATCALPFNQGIQVTLTAVADPDSVFTGWSGDCSGTADCVLEIDGPHSVSANFNGPRRPDGLVGVAGKPLKGAGIFNATGAGQTQSGTVKAGKKKTYNVVIKNVGSQADAFTITGEEGMSPFKVNYLVEGINITGPIVAGTYRSPSLWSQESLTLQVVVKAKKGAKKGDSQSWLTTATSVNDPAKSDAVKVTAKVKKKKK